MKQRVIYPGTFDPMTNGHLDIIRRSSKMFSSIVVAVAQSSSKKPLFDLESRVYMAKCATKNIPNVEVQSFSNLLADFAREQQSHIIIRGLRAMSDFEYELQVGYANSSLNSNLETLYLMPSLNNAFISSSVVRSILEHSLEISHLVPKEVFIYIRDKFKIRRN